MMLKRKEDWQQALNKTVEAARERPFLWGEHDCCIFTTSVVEAMTGVDLMQNLRGEYTTEEEAKEVLKIKCGKTLYRTLQKFFGQAISPAIAHRGDVMYRRDGDFPSVGICLGDVSVFVGANETSDGSKSADGLVSVKTLSCLKGFRV